MHDAAAETQRLTTIVAEFEHQPGLNRRRDQDHQLPPGRATVPMRPATVARLPTPDMEMFSLSELEPVRKPDLDFCSGRRGAVM